MQPNASTILKFNSCMAVANRVVRLYNSSTYLDTLEAVDGISSKPFKIFWITWFYKSNLAFYVMAKVIPMSEL